MRSFQPLAILSSILLATTALAQRQTITLPYADGDTLVISVGTGRLGALTTTTLQTLTAGAGGVLTTPVTTPLTTPTRTNTRTTTTLPVAGGDDPVQPTQTRGRGTELCERRPVGFATCRRELMKDFYDPGNGGEWLQATWTASVTALPTVATAIVPEGTIQDYAQYQSVINSAALSNAEQANANGTRTGGAGRRSAWSGAVLGAAGVGIALAM